MSWAGHSHRRVGHIQLHRTAHVSDWDTGESRDKLFESTWMWDAEPAVVSRGDQKQVTLKLKPKDSYLLRKTR